jgi:WD40 repeat protein
MRIAERLRGAQSYVRASCYLALLIVVVVVPGCLRRMSGAEDNLRLQLRALNEREGLWIGVWRSGFTQLFPFAPDPRVEIKLPRTYFSGNFTTDGEHIVATGGDELFVLSLSGAILKKRRGMLDVLYADLSKDLTTVAFGRPDWGASGHGGDQRRKMQFYYGSVDSDENKFIAEGEQLGDHYSDLISWSPDGREVVLSLAGEVRIYDLSSGSFRPLGKGLDPTWSPDGNWIAFRTADGKAMIARPHAGEPSTMMRARQVLFGLQWSPDSKYLLFSEYESRSPMSDTRLVVYRLSDGATESIFSTYVGATNRYFGWVRYRTENPVRSIAR